MIMKIFVFVVILACAYAAEEKERKNATEAALNKDKRQTEGEAIQGHYVYRTARKQEQVAPVEEESQEEDREPSASNMQQYRPGQVISLTGQELLELQQERKAPLQNSVQLQSLQHFYAPQTENKQNLQQQFYYIDPQTSRQVAFQPSHTVIARPSSSNNGVASVGAALSVSDTGASSSDNSFDEEILALLGHPQETRSQAYAQFAQPALQVQQVASPSVAPQYQQIDRYITKVQPTKKPVTPKLRSKFQITPPQSVAGPQQYLIETTNVVQQPNQQQQPQPQQQQQPQPQQQQYKIVQPQRPLQTLRYVSIPVSQVPALQQAQTVPFTFYNPPETSQNQGLKIVAAPKLVPSPQASRTQISYRVIPNANYQQQEVAQKQYRLVESRPQSQPQQATRVEQSRIPASSIDRPVTYIKRYPEPEKPRAVKIFEQSYPEVAANPQRHPQYVSEQYYLRPISYRPTTEPRQVRYELPSYALAMEKYVEQFVEPAPAKPAQSSIYINKNIPPKKVNHQHHVKQEEPADATPQPQSAKVQHVNIEQHGQSIEERRAQLPPPKNHKAYTPEEFAALVAAGYSVTPVPVGSLETQTAQSRSSIEAEPAPLHRRSLHSRRNQYLPLRSDEAP